MSESRLEMVTRLTRGNEDNRLAEVDTLAQIPWTSRDEMITTLSVLQRITMDPSSKVRVGVCNALLRCVVETRNLDLNDRQSAKHVALMTLQNLRIDRDPAVHGKALEIEKALRQLAGY